MLPSPGQCGPVGWVSSCRPKRHRFDSRSAHMPGLPTGVVPSRGSCKKQSMDASLSHQYLSFSLSSPRSGINKKEKKLKKRKFSSVFYPNTEILSPQREEGLLQTSPPSAGRGGPSLWVLRPGCWTSQGLLADRQVHCRQGCWRPRSRRHLFGGLWRVWGAGTRHSRGTVFYYQFHFGHHFLSTLRKAMFTRIALE